MKAMHAVAAAVCVLVATTASAQAVDFGSEPTRSPRTSMLELKLGNYLPRIDSETGLTGTPFADIFGGESLLLFEVEYERQVFQQFGSLAFGLSVGYGEKFGRAREAATGLPSSESTGLRVFPLRLLGVYRLDWAAENVGIPLVPYAKAGLVAIPWTSVKGSTLEAQGMRFGYQGVAGLALQLDFLSPRMARDFDASSGVNHSYVFGEYTWLNANLFKPGFDFSDRYWMFGLGLEF